MRPIRAVHVLKHPSGKSPYWYLRFWEPTPTGKWKERWRSTRTKVKKEAERQRRELERELDAGRVAESELTWPSFVDSFLATNAGRKAPATLDLYERTLKIFTVTVEPTLLADVSVRLLEDFVQKRITENVRPATINRDLRHVRAALRWAARREHIPSAPDFKGLFVRENQKKPVIVPETDFKLLLKALNSTELVLKNRPPSWWVVFLYISYYLGLRRGETIALTWGDINLDNEEVRVQAPTSKSRRERVLPMPPGLNLILLRWKSSSSKVAPSDGVLPWPFNTYRQMYEDWSLILKASGVEQDYDLKDFRSSCASLLIANDVPTVVVRDFLGHATVATTENYYINAKPALRAAAKRRNVEPPDEDEAKPRESEM